MSRATIQDLRDQVSKSREELCNAEADLADAIRAAEPLTAGARTRVRDTSTIVRGQIPDCVHSRVRSSSAGGWFCLDCCTSLTLVTKNENEAEWQVKP